MAIFRSFSEIVNSMIERLRLTQPNLDTKEGTVARDLFIDIQADQLQQLHGAALAVAEKQSPEVASGRDLDRWASNFGIVRSPGSNANGIVVFTTNSIVIDIPIPAGTIVASRNGLRFKTIGNYILSSAEKNRFSANASRLKNSLNLVGISDSFAIEIPVQALNPGTSGNISSFQIIEHNLNDSLNITNLISFNGGSNNESDAAFRARVFSVFSGSNTGTSFGYRNAAISIPGVTDAIVIEPGNTLMLRDGTEIIKVNDGTFRILNSGTGGKVDLYILGKKLEEIVESYIYVDKSGVGNTVDERNDFVLGQANIDQTLTSEERRVNAFNNGILPLQPAESIISVVGSVSGIFAEKTINDDGSISGNYYLSKDTNADTGGSPFGFDKIKFISNNKDVSSENILKKSNNSVDPLRFSNISEISAVYQDVIISGENPTISLADRTIIQLKHFPIVTVNKVMNKTTGEVYTIVSQNQNNEGINTTGKIIISGKSLPSVSDVLSADYVWRLIYDKYTDYNGSDNSIDSSVNDSIDWGLSNFIKKEISIISRTDDDIEFQISTDNNISRVISVYSATQVTGTLSIVNINDIDVNGIELNINDDEISDIISITNEHGVEIYNTPNGNGYFSSRLIALPTDADLSSSLVTIFYNKIELYNIDDYDGSFNNNTITLPSEDILEKNGIYDLVNEFYLTGDNIFIDYVANINNVVPSITLSLLPINGSDNSNLLFDNVLTVITGSNQPTVYEYDSSGEITNILKNSPSRLSLITRGTNNSGKIKILGEVLSRHSIVIDAGIALNGLTLDLITAIKSELGITTIPSNIGIGIINNITTSQNKNIDLIGQKLSTNIYGFGKVSVDTNLENWQVTLPSTDNNNSLSFSSGEKLTIELLIYNNNDFEELYFTGNSKVITSKVFSKIQRISVSSGFRATGGSLVGNLQITLFNQPEVGSLYLTDYSFVAPSEGERITIRYNLNRLISDVTANLENVRCITADVLVKEVLELSVDVRGEIIINSNASIQSDTIIENVSNAIVNLLNTGTLGRTIDYSDLINIATSIQGVDSVNISLFNESGQVGRKNYIKGLDNQNIVAGEVIFTAVSRKNFKIT